MAEHRRHGGGCCGISHMANVGAGLSRDPTAVKKSLSDVLNRIEGTNKSLYKVRGRLVEVALTSGQLKADPVLVEWLKEKGFKLVSRFINSNSGNIVNVFHYTPNPLPVLAEELGGKPSNADKWLRTWFDLDTPSEKKSTTQRIKEIITG